MNPMLGDTGFALPVPQAVTPFRYGALMRYMKLHHDATVLGISHCKNGRGMELNPVISTEVRGGMWLHGRQQPHHGGRCRTAEIGEAR